MEEDINQKIKEMVERKEVFIFIKGTPEEPYCKFSKKVLEILEELEIKNFGFYNVFDDILIREGIKNYTVWPTIPQIFVKGKFIGGHDIFLEMHESGDLKKLIFENL